MPTSAGSAPFTSDQLCNCLFSLVACQDCDPWAHAGTTCSGGTAAVQRHLLSAGITWNMFSAQVGRLAFALEGAITGACEKQAGAGGG